MPFELTQLQQDIANYLCQQFIGKPEGFPSDECEEEAMFIIAKVLSLLEPVELEVLGDEEIREYYLGSRLTAVKDAIQAAIQHNQSKGQLYRVKKTL